MGGFPSKAASRWPAEPQEKEGETIRRSPYDCYVRCAEFDKKMFSIQHTTLNGP